MCSFCSNHLVFGKALRKIDRTEVFKGIDTLVDEVAVRAETEKDSPLKLHINFEDDNILFYKKYFLEVLNYTKERCEREGITFSFTVENGMDYLLLDGNLLKQFKSLNLRQLNISMASMDFMQLASEKREGHLYKLESIISVSRELEIPVITYFICGLKGDTPGTITDTINYLHTLDTAIGISLYYPVPGLADWRDRTIFNNLPPKLCCGSSAHPWNGSLTTRELITAFRLARTSNYLKSSELEESDIQKLFKHLMDDKTLDRDMLMNSSLDCF